MNMLRDDRDSSSALGIQNLVMFMVLIVILTLILF
jgi:hypothetical protein